MSTTLDVRGSETSRGRTITAGRLRGAWCAATVLLLAACSSAPSDTDYGTDPSQLEDDTPKNADLTAEADDTAAETPAEVAEPQELAAVGDRCADGFPRGAPGGQRIVRAFSPALEGVAVCPNGDVFVSQPATAQIFRVPLDGSEPELWTTLPGHQPLGMDCASDGVLYAADFGSNNASVFRIAAKNDPGTALPKLPGGGGYKAMNGVAAVKGVGVYATDRSNTLNGRIILFAEKSPNVFEASVVRSGLVFPNDVAYDRTTNRLDSTATVNGQVFTFPVAPGGALGALKVAWTGAFIIDALDGLTIAENGDRYVARYLRNFVSRTSDGKKVADMKEPKSLAFRGGTLLVTGATGLFAVDLGVCGAAR